MLEVHVETGITVAAVLARQLPKWSYLGYLDAAIEHDRWCQRQVARLRYVGGRI
jgi:hypothetical protein